MVVMLKLIESHEMAVNATLYNNYNYWRFK